MITLINHQGLKLIKGLQIQTPAPPLGLAYIGAFLKKNGYSYTAVDSCGEAMDQILPSELSDEIMIQGLTIPQIIERIPADTKIMGFTCLFAHCWPLVVKIAEAVRNEFPDALFVAGGEHPSALPEQALKKGLFDLVIKGEGEETFLEFAQKIENDLPWQEMDGIIYLKDDKEIIENQRRPRIKALDDLPYPDWDSWCIETYIKHNQVSGINLGRAMPILGSRGCPYGCTFCSNENMWTKRYIVRDGKPLVDEMEYMINKYKVTGFSFFDSAFVVNRRKTLDFCDQLINRKLNITYQLPAGTRCEVFDDELAIALERSGLRNFCFAPESGSDMIRKVVKKQINMDSFYKAVKAVKKTDMTVGCFIVIGFPEDNKETMKETLSMLRKLAVMGVCDATVMKFTPYPGSVYFDKLRKEGYFGDKFEELNLLISYFSEESISYSKSLTSKQLHRWMQWMFINFYVISIIIRPWDFLKNFWDYFTKGVERTRYMRFFSEMFFNRKRWKKQGP